MRTDKFDAAIAWLTGMRSLDWPEGVTLDSVEVTVNSRAHRFTDGTKLATSAAKATREPLVWEPGAHFFRIGELDECALVIHFPTCVTDPVRRAMSDTNQQYADAVNAAHELGCVDAVARVTSATGELAAAVHGNLPDGDVIRAEDEVADALHDLPERCQRCHVITDHENVCLAFDFDAEECARETEAERRRECDDEAALMDGGEAA